MKSKILSVLVAALVSVLFVSCSDPEIGSKKLFTEAAMLVRESDKIDTDPLTSYKMRKSALELIKQIQIQYPSSALAVKMAEGEFTILGQSIDNIESKLVDIFSVIATGDIEFVKYLISHGTDINLRDTEYPRVTPLCFAAENGYKEIVELLLAEGADINAKSDRGLDGWPSGNASVEWFRKVSPETTLTDDQITLKVYDLARGGDERFKVFYQDSSFMERAKELDQARAMSIGENVYAKIENGKTALRAATDNGHKEIAEILRKHGAEDYK